jgi:hypothetical protein
VNETQAGGYKLPESFTILFICQGGRLEFQCLVLAASLHRHLKLDCRKYALVPEPMQGIERPEEKTLSLLRDLGVHVVEFDNPWARSLRKRNIADLLTNKIHCLCSMDNTDKTIFLDSDTFFYRDFTDGSRFAIPLNLKLIGYPGASAMARWWRSMETHFDIDFTTSRFCIQADGKPSLFIPPFFNTSFFALPSTAVSDFREVWADAYRELTDMPLTPRIPYQREQAAFAVAVHKTGLPFEMCHSDLNKYCIHYSKSLPAKPDRVRRIESLLADYTEIRRHLMQDESWRKLFTDIKSA